MTINLDTHELWYLLEGCLRGSHLRSTTIERFTNEFYDKLSEEERMSLFEWAVRLGYCWKDHNHFEPSPHCCGHDIEFMKRYHPCNQYYVRMEHYRKLSSGKLKKEFMCKRAFKMNGRYYISSTQFCDEKCIIKVTHDKELAEEWQKYKQPNIDYDTNILE